MWIPVKERLPKSYCATLITVKDLANDQTHVIACQWGSVVDMETGEIIGGPSFVNYVETKDKKICVNYNNMKEFRVTAWMPFPTPYQEQFRVIIAGSRTFENYRMAKETLDKVFSKHWPTAIVCGEAKGADTLGKRYAMDRGIPVDSYPADWVNHGKQAGYIRNEQMADNADALIAFWNGTSSGTKHMIDTAKKRNLQVRVINF